LIEELEDALLDFTLMFLTDQMMFVWPELKDMFLKTLKMYEEAYGWWAPEKKTLLRRLWEKIKRASERELAEEICKVIDATNTFTGALTSYKGVRVIFILPREEKVLVDMVMTFPEVAEKINRKYETLGPEDVLWTMEDVVIGYYCFQEVMGKERPEPHVWRIYETRKRAGLLTDEKKTNLRVDVNMSLAQAWVDNFIIEGTALSKYSTQLMYFWTLNAHTRQEKELKITIKGMSAVSEPRTLHITSPESLAKCIKDMIVDLVERGWTTLFIPDTLRTYGLLLFARPYLRILLLGKDALKNRRLFSLVHETPLEELVPADAQAIMCILEDMSREIMSNLSSGITVKLLSVSRELTTRLRVVYILKDILGIPTFPDNINNPENSVYVVMFPPPDERGARILTYYIYTYSPELVPGNIDRILDELLSALDMRPIVGNRDALLLSHLMFQIF